METDIDTTINDAEENSVSEPTAASGFGNPSLDADRIDDDTDAAIDSLLDEAVKESGEEIQTEIEPSSPEPTPVQLGAVPTPPQQSQIDPEIAAIEQPRNLSEKNQTNWRKLQETASTYKRQAEEAEVLRQRLVQMEGQQQQYQMPPDYDELRKFRQIFDIKNDPEFQSKYSQPISAAKDNIYNILKKHGASDEVIQSIEKAGGPDKIDSSWWKNNAIDKLPMTDSERLKLNLVDVVDLKEKQEQEIQYAAENIEQIMAQREQQTHNWYNEETSNIENHIDALTKDLPWARFAEIPAGASQEEIQKLTKHNETVGALSEKFQSALWPQNAQDRANVAAAAVFSHVLTDELRRTQSTAAQLSAQLKKLTEENNRLKGASRMPRSSVSSSSSNKGSSLNDRIKMSPSDAIDLGLDEAEA
jgi:hypothetical protein